MLTPPSPFSRCFNRDGERASAKVTASPMAITTRPHVPSIARGLLRQVPWVGQQLTCGATGEHLSSDTASGQEGRRTLAWRPRPQLLVYTSIRVDYYYIGIATPCGEQGPIAGGT